MSFIEKIFGSYSAKELKKIEPLVEKIESLASEMEQLKDEDIRNKTREYRNRVQNGESLDNILPEAFALVREASKRALGMVPFKVQLIGGIVLHQGRIAEMKTGEGKTLVATLPAYLNALTGKGVHIVTVNDYLAKTQSLWMGKLYRFLGLSVGLVIHGMNEEQKRFAYACDITYGTNNEFGFDYLRDNMALSLNDMSQRELNFAIVDEIDSILIDEARTPLIISGNAEKSTDLYIKAEKFVKGLKGKVLVENDDKNFDESLEEFDYVVDLKAHSASLTENGASKAESYFGIEDLSDLDNSTIFHHVNQAIKAHGLMHNEKDYIVKDGEVIIVDEFTGRLMYGRRYSDGLHQAIEAKERVEIANESKTLATITLQNYFRMYNKLSGMTGTAKTEEDEFKGIYSLDVIEIPTNKPAIRQDLNDVVYKSVNGKYNAIVQDIKESYEKGQPVLVGTVSIDKSEIISKMLRAEKIPHEVLNAKYHDKEAQIIAQAGKYKAITIATNMAGRGTDIVLGGNSEFMAKNELRRQGYDDEIIELASSPIISNDPEIEKVRAMYKKFIEGFNIQVSDEKGKVIAAGGLKIIGSERHESRRIDNQLRGRAGRQGDPGISKFYISLEDDLMKLFGSDKILSLAEAMGLPEDMPIEQKMLTNTIETAQKRVEGRNFSIRKNVLEFDDVMNKQREIIYSQRKTLLVEASIRDMLYKIMESQIEKIVAIYMANVEVLDELDILAFNTNLESTFDISNIIEKEDIEEIDIEYITNMVKNKVISFYETKEKTFEAEGHLDILRQLEKLIMLRVVDKKWMDHIDNMDALKEGIYLRAYGQNNPVQEYKIESFNMFEEMVDSIQKETLKSIFSVAPQKEQKAIVKMDAPIVTGYQGTELNTGITNGEKPTKKEPIRKEQTVGRNEPCPCGSGKKYKQCCGKDN